MPLMNAVSGTPGDQFVTSTAKTANPMGSIMSFADGRAFRYSRAAGTAIATARLCQQTLNDATWDELVVPTARSIGDTTVTVTNEGTTAFTVDLLADGYLNVEDDTGEGYLYTIKSNNAAAISGTLTVVLYEPLQVAWTTATTVNTYVNPFSRVIIHPSPALALLTGVTTGAVAASAYHWQAVRGPASTLTDTVVCVINENVVDGLNVDGAVTAVLVVEAAPPTATGQNVIGVAMEVSAAAEQGITWMTMVV